MTMRSSNQPRSMKIQYATNYTSLFILFFLHCFCLYLFLFFVWFSWNRNFTPFSTSSFFAFCLFLSHTQTHLHRQCIEREEIFRNVIGNLPFLCSLTHACKLLFVSSSTTLCFVFVRIAYYVSLLFALFASIEYTSTEAMSISILCETCEMQSKIDGSSVSAQWRFKYQ